MTKIFETHCHLDYFDNPSEVIQRANEAGVDKIITISVSPDNINKVVEIAQSHEGVYCSQGIHPHEAKNATSKCWDTIRQNVKNPKSNSKILAIGECGLDYHYDYSPRDIQKEVFETQLDLAKELNLPVVFHTRESDEDTLAILKNHSKDLKRKGVLHSYTGGVKLMEYALSEGFYVGFNGIATFKNAQNVKELVKMVPADRLLIETDAPYLAPTPHRGKKNESMYLPHILEYICELKGLESGDIFYQNSVDLFGP